MADLREVLGAVGYTDVRTHLNSGNALFTGDDADPAEHAARIEAAITERLRLDVGWVVLTADALRAVVDGNPLADVVTNGSRMMVHVLEPAPDQTLIAEHDPIA